MAVYSQNLPSYLYVNRFASSKSVHLIKVDSLARISIGINRLFARNDTIHFVLKDNSRHTYMMNSIDSISMEKPEELLSEVLAQYNVLSNGKFPTYGDDYTTTNISWSNYKNWNLANVHDPTVMKATDGYYYMYQTDAGYGNPQPTNQHFYCRRSKDMVTWEGLGCVMTGTPTWCVDSLNAIRSRMGLPLLGSTSENQANINIFWAPCARKVNDNLYRLYYVVAPSNYIKTGNDADKYDFDYSWGERAFIGLMETTDPASNKWEDKGYVICSASDKGMTESAWTRPSTSNWSGYFKWNAIDPSYIITPTGEHWLIYGSWHGGECAIQLEASTGKLLKDPGNPWNIGTGITTTYGKRINTRLASSRWQGSEAPEVIYNPETEYYYLFLAYDGLDIPYNTRVCRSRNVDGPYYDIRGTNVSSVGGECFPILTHPYKFDDKQGRDISGWVGIAHCAVWDDGEGNYYYASQGRLPANYNNNTYSNAVMMGHIRSIRWTSRGWPVVMPQRYANVPQATITTAEFVGEWEHINLGYEYGVQQTSRTITFLENGVVNGALSGIWNYNNEGQYLTIKSGTTTIELCVQRELDWEAVPRKATLVYAGFSNDGRTTYWGKKI